jgi:hypothetical protein
MRAVLVVVASAPIAVLALATFAPRAALALQQPDGTTIPYSPPSDPPGVNGCAGGSKPSGLLPIFACQCMQAGICNIGTPCASQTSCDDGQHGMCESTMWHSFNDNTCIPSNHSGLDPVAAATTAAQTFHPTCALTFTVVSRGRTGVRHGQAGRLRPRRDRVRARHGHLHAGGAADARSVQRRRRRLRRAGR